MRFSSFKIAGALLLIAALSAVAGMTPTSAWAQSTPAMPTSPTPGSTSSPGPTTSSSSVTLGWSRPSGATFYDIGVRDMSTNQLVVNTQVSGASVTANLTPGRPYRWNVAACNAAGCSSFTTPRYFQTPGALPAVPGNPAPGSTSSPGPTTSSSSVTLGWSSSSGATSYDLGVRDVSTNQLVVNTQIGGTSFTVNLTPGRPYRWNVAACNAAGCSSFTTPRYFQTPSGGGGGSAPTVNTAAATAVTASSATLNATVTPNGLATTAFFQFGTTSAYGSQTSSQSVGSGSGAIGINAGLSGLTCARTYFFRAVATNSQGTTNGAGQTFTTSACQGGGTGITSPAPGSTLAGSTASFTWTCASGSSQGYLYLGNAVGGYDWINQLVAASGTQSFSGLPTDGRNLFARLWCNNGSNWTFTDYTYRAASAGGGGSAPTVNTAAATAVTTTSATLNATVNPNGLATTAYFQFGNTSAYGSQTSAQSVGSGSGAIAITAGLSGLNCGTTYYFRAVANNSRGTTNGASQTFTTSACQGGGTGITLPAPGSTLAGSTATFTWTCPSGTVQGYFYIGSSVGSSDLVNQWVAASGTQSFAGLPTDGRNLFVRLWCYNGSSWTFTDYTYRAASAGGGGSAPTVNTTVATAVTASSVTLNATVTPNGLATTAYFQFGNSLVYGIQTGAQSVGSGSGAIAITAGLSGLNCGTTYYFRAVATNALGTTNGAGQTFTTSACQGGGTGITSPAAGSTFPGSTATFTWTCASGSSQGHFYIGNSIGGADFVAQGVAASGTQSFSGLPTDGRNLYVRLWCYNGGSWTFTDYTYRAASGSGQASSFTWPTAPLEAANGYLAACVDTPNVWDGCYWLTANGWRDAQPFLRHYNSDFSGYHLGADYNWGSGSDDAGLPVYAVANGVVSSVQPNVSGWGNVVFVRHDTPWGTFTSMYAHVNWMSSGVPVLGQTVSKGQQIAVIGNGGGLYPYHLHFELRAANNTIVGPGYNSSQGGTPPQGQIDPNAFISTHR